FGKRTGRDIKSCDLLAAYIEAKASIYYGISSKPLEDGVKEIRKKLKDAGTGIGAAELIERLDRILS
ncbi:MAG: hypothetical protein FWG60_02490, partial [Methanomassiliicoccaceae archaeon]|nr:hypothetical protein [Methanomassiliicoccaceae archaeon]